MIFQGLTTAVCLLSLEESRNKLPFDDLGKKFFDDLKKKDFKRDISKDKAYDSIAAMHFK